MATKSKRYSEHDISAMLNSDSDSENSLLYETVERESEMKARLHQRKPITNNQSGSAGTESDLTPTSNSISKKKVLMSKTEKVSLRIKLRRSTEQSVYKIQFDQPTPENSLSKSSPKPKRARSNSSDILGNSVCISRNANYSNGKKEAVEETAEKGNRIASPQRSSRPRRPPLRFASYECSPLPSSTNYENSPKASIRLRNRQPINYNESSLQVKYDLFDPTPSKVKRHSSPVTRSRKREGSLSSNEAIIDTSAITRANLKKRNWNTRLSEKDTDTDTDTSSVSSTTEARAKLSRGASKMPLEGAHDNKENMLSTSKRMDGMASKIKRATRLARNKSQDTSIPIIDITSPTKSTSSANNKSVVFVRSGKDHITSNESDSDSDASTVSLEYLKQLKAESDMRAGILLGTRDISRNRTLLKETSGQGDNKNDKSKRSASWSRGDRNERNLAKEIDNPNSLYTDIISDEEERYEIKKDSQIAERKEEIVGSVGAAKRQIARQRCVPKSIPRTPKLCTPKRRILTPSIENRCSATLKPVTPLQNARARLHVGAVPKSLPCREEEFNNIFTFLKGKLMDRTGGCIYISGVPGTGKTATVNEVVKCLQKLTWKGELSDFNFIAINGMKLTDPRQSYVQILKQLTGETVPWAQACRTLQQRFQKKSLKMTLLLVDELDYLCTKRQDVIYNILDWPSKTSAHLVVITIANTMDLPERVLMSRVASRLGLTRLTFQPYNHKQLQEIVITRLKDFHAFRSEAIQLVARKVSAVSGDARRALDICRRAAEITESHDSGTISLEDVSQAISEMIASPKIQAIQHCSELEKLFLLAISAEVARTSVEEVIFQDAYMQLKSLCSFDGTKVPNVTETLAICARLGASRILICDHSRYDISQKILLNVSADDIHYAIRQSEA